MPSPRSSLFQQIPWLALMSLLVVLMCLGAAVGIVIVSNNQTVESWKIQPAVLLAILASVSNLALGTAFSGGVVVTWWLSAVNGTSLTQLHYIWDRGEGTTFKPAFAAGGNARKVALTAFVIALVKIATNPLLQRATHQRIEEITTQETVQLRLSQYLPAGWTGSIRNASIGDVRGSTQALATAQAWWHNVTIDSSDYYCDGTCSGRVTGAGIGYNCSSVTQPLDLYMGSGTVIFAINTTMSQNSTGAPVLLLTTLHASAIDDNCMATLTIDSCKIEAGVVEYPVILRNSTITLDYDKINNVTIHSTYVYPGDLPTATKGTPAGTLQGLNDFFGFYLNATTSVLNPSSYTGYSMMADMFYLPESFSYDNTTFANCHLKWSSPTNYVLNSMQNFMFRAALRASNGTDAQTFTVQRARPTLVFYSEYGYVAAASAITLLGLFAILFMLQGWWVLGRAASLSPVETARAFCAPILAHAGNNFSVDAILGNVGQIWVRYIDGVMHMRLDDNKNVVQLIKDAGLASNNNVDNVEGQAEKGERVSMATWF